MPKYIAEMHDTKKGNGLSSGLYFSVDLCNTLLEDSSEERPLKLSKHLKKDLNHKFCQVKKNKVKSAPEFLSCLKRAHLRVIHSFIFNTSSKQRKNEVSELLLAQR